MTLPINKTGVATKNRQQAFASRLLQMLTKTRLWRIQLQDYAPLLHSLLKSVSIYALASCASPLVSLVLAPFLTRTLSRTEYSILVIINTTIALFAGITQFGLDSAFFRAYNYDYELAQDRMATLSTTLLLLTLTTMPFVLVAWIAAPQLALGLFGSTRFTEPARCAIVVILLQNLAMPGFAWLRAEKRAAMYTLLTVSNLFINLMATIALVGIWHVGVIGALLGPAAGYMFVLVWVVPLLPLRACLRTGARPRLAIARNLLSFGVPLVFSFVSVWVLQLSDRYLLSWLGSLTQTASYAVAYSLGGIMAAVVLGPFSLAWPTVLYDIAKRENAVSIFQLVFRWYAIVLLFVSFSLSFAAVVILDVFFPSTYQTVAPIIPLINLAMMFYGLYTVLSVGLSLRRKTWLAFVFVTLSAILNVVLNIILIPQQGAMGAALATLLSYAVLALLVYIANQYLYPIPFEIGRFCIALVTGIGLYMISIFLSQAQGAFISWSIRCCILVIYGLYLLLLGKAPARKQGSTSKVLAAVKQDSNAKMVLRHQRGISVMKFIEYIHPAEKERQHLARSGPLKVCLYTLQKSRNDRRLMREAHALIEAGFAVTVVDVESKRIGSEEVNGICIKHIVMPGWFVSTRFKPWFLVKALWAFLRSIPYLLLAPAHIYHAYNELSLPACCLAAWLRRKPVIFEAQELMMSDPLMRRWPLLRTLATRVLRWLLSSGIAVITPSPGAIWPLRKLYRVPYVIVLRSVPLYRKIVKTKRLQKRLGLPSGTRIALYQGNFQRNRRLDILVRAARFVEQGNVIVLMGQDLEGTQEMLEKLIVAEGVADKIKLLPAVPYEELLSWTASADLGLTLFAPDYSLNIRYCLPNKFFEYLMAGLPVLSSSLDMLEDIINTYDVGQVVSSLAPEKVGAAINALLADRPALARMSQNALRVAREEFNWDKEKLVLIDLYQKILSKEIEHENADPGQ
ncbi:MAG TPA: oligosaccharide flippase family protein [Ktedonosporobacter sp.]|jgi:O-antigen/teichoic acid export membrane protein/glycosyltransferase involved in cell wall biosynthesis|nr:oligosaccharide flippase family protein [Ktedonosporobacter sp.]